MLSMRNTLGQLSKKEIAGPSFHEKSLKNQKTNQKVSRGESQRSKYGKPKSVRGKKLK